MGSTVEKSDFSQKSDFLPFKFEKSDFLPFFWVASVGCVPRTLFCLFQLSTRLFSFRIIFNFPKRQLMVRGTHPTLAIARMLDKLRIFSLLQMFR